MEKGGNEEVGFGREAGREEEREGERKGSREDGRGRYKGQMVFGHWREEQGSTEGIATQSKEEKMRKKLYMYTFPNTFTHQK